MIVRALERTQLIDATRVLASACAFDRAAVVAEEKLFAVAPRLDAPGVIAPTAFGAWE
nr:hypothetical protein [Deltaproteobacteria bacterium]